MQTSINLLHISHNALVSGASIRDFPLSYKNIMQHCNWVKVHGWWPLIQHYGICIKDLLEVPRKLYNTPFYHPLWIQSVRDFSCFKMVILINPKTNIYAYDKMSRFPTMHCNRFQYLSGSFDYTNFDCSWGRWLNLFPRVLWRLLLFASGPKVQGK